MPNWCCTAYAIEGDAKELQSLYDLMNKLQESKDPSVPNGHSCISPWQYNHVIQRS